MTRRTSRRLAQQCSRITRNGGRRTGGKTLMICVLRQTLSTHVTDKNVVLRTSHNLKHCCSVQNKKNKAKEKGVSSSELAEQRPSLHRMNLHRMNPSIYVRQLSTPASSVYVSVSCLRQHQLSESASATKVGPDTYRVRHAGIKQLNTKLQGTRRRDNHRRRMTPALRTPGLTLSITLTITLFITLSLSALSLLTSGFISSVRSC